MPKRSNSLHKMTEMISPCSQTHNYTQNTNTYKKIYSIVNVENFSNVFCEGISS